MSILQKCSSIPTMYRHSAIHIWNLGWKPGDCFKLSHNCGLMNIHLAEHFFIPGTVYFVLHIFLLVYYYAMISCLYMEIHYGLSIILKSWAILMLTMLISEEELEMYMIYQQIQKSAVFHIYLDIIQLNLNHNCVNIKTPPWLQYRKSI